MRPKGNIPYFLEANDQSKTRKLAWDSAKYFNNYGQSYPVFRRSSRIVDVQLQPTIGQAAADCVTRKSEAIGEVSYLFL